MTDPSSRRNFLRGRFTARKGPLRPPWALVENDFLHACTRCGECVKACPTQVISAHDAGYPSMNFTAGECTFCGACVDACKSSALKRVEGQPPWKAQATLGEQCLAQRKIECRICADQCETRAIRFTLRPGGIAIPAVDSSACTGCGACVAPCPAGAIRIG
ncbi:ferredoxin-type protein NapF [Noviherbaspirillum agri]